MCLWLAPLWAAACGTIQAGGPAGPWQSPLGRDHPLIGRIWDAAGRRFVEAPALAERLARGHFILLGEKHDNPDHHLLQAWLVRALVDAGRRPAVGFEMLTLDDAPALARYLAGHPMDASGFGEAVGWERSGWPPWPMYRPIADVALAGGLPMVATNLPRAAAQGAARRGTSAVDPILVARFGLDRPLPPELRAEMAAEAQASHCNGLPESLLDGMIAAQRARDAQMAERLVSAGERDGAVLIAGDGHVRRDRGVPAFLAQVAPGTPAISVALLEVQRDQNDPEDYATAFGRGPFPVDYVWFTPRLDDTDPCEKFRAPLDRLRKRE